jgi:hypothetical protein
LVQINSSKGIDLPTAGTHPQSHHLEKISEEEGSFKEEEKFMKEIEAKMT